MTHDELVEFGRRAVDSYALMFPDDPAVIRFQEARRALAASLDEFNGFFDAD